MPTMSPLALLRIKNVIQTYLPPDLSECQKTAQILSECVALSMCVLSSLACWACVLVLAACLYH